MNNVEVLRKFLDALVKIGAKNTSENYIKIVLESLINNLSTEHKALRFVTFKNSIKIDLKINSMDLNDLSLSMTALLCAISNPCVDKYGTNIFYKEFLGYIGYKFEQNLRYMGVTLQ
jgi:hypothetical protein